VAVMMFLLVISNSPQCSLFSSPGGNMVRQTFDCYNRRILAVMLTTDGILFY